MSAVGRFLRPLGRALEATFAWAGTTVVSVVRVVSTVAQWAVTHPVASAAIGIGLVASSLFTREDRARILLGGIGMPMIALGVLGYRVNWTFWWMLHGWAG